MVQVIDLDFWLLEKQIQTQVVPHSVAVLGKLLEELIAVLVLEVFLQEEKMIVVEFEEVFVKASRGLKRVEQEVFLCASVN